MYIYIHHVLYICIYIYTIYAHTICIYVYAYMHISIYIYVKWQHDLPDVLCMPSGWPQKKWFFRMPIWRAKGERFGRRGGNVVKTYSGHPAINDIEYGIIHDYHGIKRFFTMVEPKKYGVRPLVIKHSKGKSTVKRCFFMYRPPFIEDFSIATFDYQWVFSYSPFSSSAHPMYWWNWGWNTEVREWLVKGQ